MPEVSFWLNSVFAEAKFNFILNGAEKALPVLHHGAPQTACVLYQPALTRARREKQISSFNLC